MAERPVVLPPERLEELRACLPIKVRAFRLVSALQNAQLWRRQRKEMTQAERLRYAQEEALLQIPGRSSRQAKGRYATLKQF
jgi:hypothetical protein